MLKLNNQLVECPQERDAYYSVSVFYRKRDNCYLATIPCCIGRVIVAKGIHQFPEPHEDFAWKVQKEEKDEKLQNTLFGCDRR